MKNGLLLFLIVLISVSFCKKPGRSYELEVKYNGKYCGGAKPNDEILLQYALHREFGNSVIKICPVGKKKPVYKVKTNAFGQAKVVLPDGEWKYSLTNEVSNDVLYINEKCSESINKIYGTFKTDSTTKSVIELLYHFECDPCDPNSKKRQ
jgi:hypothetical protein